MKVFNSINISSKKAFNSNKQILYKNTHNTSFKYYGLYTSICNKSFSSFNNDEDPKNILRIFDKNFDNLKRANIMPASRDTLRIYRDCVKLCKKFYWNDDRGKRWSDTLLKTVRRDFERNRDMDDSIEIGKMQVQARQALIELENKLAKVSFDIGKFLHDTRNNKQ